MLKLKQNIVPEGVIDGINTTFKTTEIIGAIQSIYVDGVIIDNNTQTSDILTIKLDVAPTVSIIVNYFCRELSAISGNGEVTLGSLKTDFYRKIGRVNADGSVPANINKLYPEDYIKEEIKKSVRRMNNQTTAENRIQEYSFSTQNGYKITAETSTHSITAEEKITNEIDGVFLIEKGVLYEYYSLIGNSFQTADIDLSDIGDKIIVGHRIPYGVNRISSIRVDGVPFTRVDERMFNMNASCTYTIIKDFQGNEYLFFSYSEDPLTYNIKYIPDLNNSLDEEDIIDVPYEYTDLFVYDVASKLLRDKEDDRWAGFKQEVGDGVRTGLLYEYKSYLKSKRAKFLPKIGLAKTFNRK